MMHKKTIFIGCLLFYILQSSAQSNFLSSQFMLQAPDSAMIADGLAFGFHINSEKEKEVGDKGNFSRYSIQFFITNVSGEAKIFLYNQGLQILNDVSPYIIQFNCLNATGARLTSKSVQLQMAACNVLGIVDGKDQNNKPQRNKQFVQVGYWIKPNETLKATAIIIVPLNEKPNVQATLYPNMNAKIISNGSYIQQQPLVNQQPQNIFNNDANAFYKIKNVNIQNSYINNQQGALTYSTINADWWSAQWQVIPIAGSDYVNIKNRWKENFVSIDNGMVVLTNNYSGDACKWMMEPSQSAGAFRLRNAVTGGYLCIASNILKTAINYNNVSTADWLFERQ
jgi:hypothetical protein